MFEFWQSGLIRSVQTFSDDHPLLVTPIHKCHPEVAPCSRQDVNIHELTPKWHCVWSSDNLLGEKFCNNHPSPVTVTYSWCCVWNQAAIAGWRSSSCAWRPGGWAGSRSMPRGHQNTGETRRHRHCSWPRSHHSPTPGDHCQGQHKWWKHQNGNPLFTTILEKENNN